jgi:hypothetical protein
LPTLKIDWHYRSICKFWTPNAAAYTGLGRMYVDDERFRPNYDKVATGLAEFQRDAMAVYCPNQAEPATAPLCGGVADPPQSSATHPARREAPDTAPYGRTMHRPRGNNRARNTSAGPVRTPPLLAA